MFRRNYAITSLPSDNEPCDAQNIRKFPGDLGRGQPRILIWFAP